MIQLRPHLQEDDRRIAEVQYKRCCALQFSGEVEVALPAVQVGLGTGQSLLPVQA